MDEERVALLRTLVRLVLPKAEYRWISGSHLKRATIWASPTAMNPMVNNIRNAELAWEKAARILGLIA